MPQNQAPLADLPSAITGPNRASSLTGKKLAHEAHREMRVGILLVVFSIAVLHRIRAEFVPSLCEFTAKDKKSVYQYALATSRPNFPHGILSEDGFYRVTTNGTTLWFQLCGSMIFNHDPPLCVNCEDCGGSSSRCGMGCSALVSNKIEGYPVCTTLGRPSSTAIVIRERKSPHSGVIVMMNDGTRQNCSLYVSVVCDSNKVQGPRTLEVHGPCEYSTEIKHPLGCAKITSHDRSGFGWFGTLMIIILCLFGAYLVAGAVYRHFVLHVRGLDVIPHLELWTSLPHTVQSCFQSSMRRLSGGGPSHVHRSSYSPVNF